MYFKTATSFLKASNCAGVGWTTFSFFTATGPCQWPQNTVPNDPEPIRRINIISLSGSSHSSFESRRSRYRLENKTKYVEIKQTIWDFGYTNLFIKLFYKWISNRSHKFSTTCCPSSDSTDFARGRICSDWLVGEPLALWILVGLFPWLWLEPELGGAKQLVLWPEKKINIWKSVLRLHQDICP